MHHNLWHICNVIPSIRLYMRCYPWHRPVYLRCIIILDKALHLSCSFHLLYVPLYCRQGTISAAMKSSWRFVYTKKCYSLGHKWSARICRFRFRFSYHFVVSAFLSINFTSLSSGQINWGIMLLRTCRKISENSNITRS